MILNQFKTPRNQILRVQYIKRDTNQNPHLLAVVTESTVTNKFYLYLPDKNGIFSKAASGDDPDFKELNNIYGVHKKKVEN